MLALGLGIGMQQRVAGSSGPALALNFLSGALDSRITFTRASSATFVGSNGLIQTATTDTPRFDYDPVTLAAKGLLIEEQRTNVVIQSGNLADAAWTNGSVTVSGGVSDPFGGTSAFTLTASAANAYLRQFFATAGQFTQSVWVRRRTGSGNIQSFSGVAYVNMAVTSTWTRIVSVGDQAAPSNYFMLFFSTSGDAIDVYYPQFEAGAFATSYIPTTSAAVTRAADLASMTGSNFSSWYAAATGTFVTTGDCPASGTRPLLEADDDTTTNLMRLYGSGTDPKFDVTTGGAAQASIDAGSIVANTAFKFAAAYTVNDFAASASGGAAVTDVSGTIPTVDRLRIGADKAGNYLNGHISAITYYNTRLTNAQIQALTT